LEDNTGTYLSTFTVQAINPNGSTKPVGGDVVDVLLTYPDGTEVSVKVMDESKNSPGTLQSYLEQRKPILLMQSWLS